MAGWVVVMLLAGCTGSPTVGVLPEASAPSQPPSVPPMSAPPSTPTATPAPTSTPTLQQLYETNRDALLAIGTEKGPAAALRTLERRIRKVPALEGVCHPIAHELGHEAVEMAGGGIAGAQAALKARDDVCGGGYTHGAIEAALGESKHPARDLLRICAPANDGSCFHGVGHGLMFATSMDVDRSLTLCDRSPTATLAARCGEGVFMQLFSADLSAGHTGDGGLTAAAEDPAVAAEVCRGTRSPYVANCWFYAPTVWLASAPDDFAGAMAWCRSEARGSGRQMCARGVGSRAVKYHPDDLMIGATVCASAPGVRDSCFEGMGSYWSVHHRGRVAPQKVCAAIPDVALSARCRDAV